MTTPKSKTTITIDAAVLDQVKKAVAAGQSSSVSAYIEHAVIGQLSADTDFDLVIAELLDASGGEPSKHELLEARRLLSGSAA
ncbi:MAG: hypothetical protein V3V01_20150 [Acidimicrobiales bacterium]